MKRIIALSATLLIGLTMANAQVNDRSMPRHEGPMQKGERMNEEKKMQEMDNVVKFSEEQKAEIKTLNEAHKKKHEEMRLRHKKMMDEIQAEKKAAKKEHREAIKKVMTEEQRKKWQEHQKAKKPQQKSQGKGNNSMK